MCYVSIDDSWEFFTRMVQLNEMRDFSEVRQLIQLGVYCKVFQSMILGVFGDMFQFRVTDKSRVTFQ